MLGDEEIVKIKKLIDEGKTDYMIGKLLNHSPNTIKNVRGTYQYTGESVTQGEEIHLKNPIDQTRKLADDIDNLIYTGNLRAGEKKKQEKQLKNIRDILREEVDEKLSEVEASTVEKQNKIWNIFLSQNYVKKEDVTNLNNIIFENNTTINNLRNSISEKDILIQNIQDEMSQLKDTFNRQIEMLHNHMRNLSNKNIELEETVGDLSGYIGDYLDDAGRRERENLMYEKEKFEMYREEQQSAFNKLFIAADEDLKVLEKREVKLDLLEEKVKKREENTKKEKEEIKTQTDKQKLEIDEFRNKTYEEINRVINTVDKRAKDVTESEKKLKMWYHAKKKELSMDEKRSKEHLDKREGIIKDMQSQIKKDQEKNNEIEEGQKAERQRLEKLQTHIRKNEGFNKFSLPCSYCRKPMFFDAADPDTHQKLDRLFGNDMHIECRSKFEQRNPTVLIPVSYSGEPILQSGFPQINQYGRETIGDDPNVNPSFQSGFSPTIISSDEVKTIESSSEPVMQSGYSQIIQSGGEPIIVQSSGEPAVQSGCPPVYYSGTKVFNKN